MRLYKSAHHVTVGAQPLDKNLLSRCQHQQMLLPTHSLGVPSLPSRIPQHLWGLLLDLETAVFHLPCLQGLAPGKLGKMDFNWYQQTYCL